MEGLWTCWKQSRAAVRRNKCVSLLGDGKNLAFSWISPRSGHPHRWAMLPGVLLACPPTRLNCPELPRPWFWGIFICSGQIWDLCTGRRLILRFLSKSELHFPPTNKSSCFCFHCPHCLAKSHCRNFLEKYSIFRMIFLPGELLQQGHWC